jgi:uncharacterized coiled-coil protein SlyX|tara:strand:+ start:946 stop:1098 length:153 start_codon:yes stop_codon:yes gene_type:complete
MINRKLEIKLQALEVRINAQALHIRRCKNEIASLRAKVQRLQKENDNEVS